jgi:hypothetical protein
MFYGLDEYGKIAFGIFLTICFIFSIIKENNGTQCFSLMSVFERGMGYVVLSGIPLFFIYILVICIEGTLFKGELFGKERLNGTVKIERILESKYGYHIYYFEDNQAKGILIPKEKARIEFSSNRYNARELYYRLTFSREGNVIEAEGNYANIILPKGEKPENYQGRESKYLLRANKGDIIFKNIKRDECLNEIRYQDGQFSFYILEDYLTEFTFKENEALDIKVKFTRGDTKSKKACLNFDYYETINGDIVDRYPHKNHFEIIVPEDFELSDLKK